MTKKTFLTATLILITSYIHPYDVADIREIKDITAILRASGAVIAATSPSGASDELSLITDLSREINKIAANTIKEQSPIIRVARILERISIEAPLQKADFSDFLYYKKLTLVIAHCLTREIALRYKNKGVSFALDYISDNQLLAEVTHALTKGLVIAAVDTTFAQIKHTFIAHKDTHLKLMAFFATRFLSAATKDLAYRAAGEIVRRNAKNATRSELFADIFDAKNEENLF